MTKPRRASSFYLLCLLLIACAEPRIDTSTDDRMKVSIAEARASLPENRRAQFDTALQVLAFSGLSFGNLLAEGVAPGAGDLESKLKGQLNGRTASQVIAAADSVRRERARQEREQALKEIAELEARQERADSGRTELVKFVVLRSRFYQRRNVLDMAEPIIELTVRNGTNHAISRAYFVGTLSSPGRSVPWLRESFNHSIRGGIEPGEQATLTLAPNMFSDWAKVKPPRDAILTVDVVRLDGPSGETLFSTTDFDEDDAARLDTLRAMFGR